MGEVLNRCFPKSIFEQVFFPTDGQQAHKKMLNIVNHQRSANQNCNEISPHSCQNQFGSVQLHSSVQLFATPRTAACQASLSIPSYWSLLKLMSVEQMMPSNHLILCRPLLLLPSIFSSIRVCFNESVFHIKRPKCWSFSFSISPSHKYLALISFRIDSQFRRDSQESSQHLSEWLSSKRTNVGEDVEKSEKVKVLGTPSCPTLL